MALENSVTLDPEPKTAVKLCGEIEGPRASPRSGHAPSGGTALYDCDALTVATSEHSLDDLVLPQWIVLVELLARSRSGSQASLADRHGCGRRPVDCGTVDAGNRTRPPAEPGPQGSGPAGPVGEARRHGGQRASPWPLPPGAKLPAVVATAGVRPYRGGCRTAVGRAAARALHLRLSIP